MPGTEEKIEKGLKEAGRLIDKIKEVVDIFKDKPISTGNREDLEDCIGKLSTEEVANCRVRSSELTFYTGFEYSRFFGLSSDSIDVDITLHWSFDGCHLYDIYYTETNTATTSDWIVTPKVTISKLQKKKKGECKCCIKGGDCVLIKVEVEGEYEAAFFPNPTMTKKLFTGTLCAADGRLTKS